jgi:hypothetical protein
MWMNRVWALHPDGERRTDTERKAERLDPREYLRTAVHAGLRGEQIPLPRELVPAA